MIFPTVFVTLVYCSGFLFSEGEEFVNLDTYFCSQSCLSCILETWQPTATSILNCSVLTPTSEPNCEYSLVILIFLLKYCQSVRLLVLSVSWSHLFYVLNFVEQVPARAAAAAAVARAIAGLPPHQRYSLSSSSAELSSIYGSIPHGPAVEELEDEFYEEVILTCITLVSISYCFSCNMNIPCV